MSQRAMPVNGVGTARILLWNRHLNRRTWRKCWHAHWFALSFLSDGFPLWPLQPRHGLHAPEGRQVERDQEQEQDDHSDSQRCSKWPVAGLEKLVGDQVSHKDIF